MKKLFTLIAFLAVFLGAKAEWVQIYQVDYSTYNGFPFFVMGYVPEWSDGIMTDLGGNFTYKTEAAEGDEVVGSTTTHNGTVYQRIVKTDGTWHQYFIADGIKTNLDGSYTVKAMVKATAAVTMNVNMGWGWGDGQQMGASVTIPASEDFVEVEWQYTGIGGTSCNLVAQPNSDAIIEWKSVTVFEDQSEEQPVTWQEWLTSDGLPQIIETTFDKVPNYMGNAETPWGDLANVRFDDQTQNFLICAWSKEKGRNMNDDGGWDPFPADIEEVDGSHVFVCHGQPATTEGDASAWDNQFWIQSPKSWKAGEQIHIHFRYKASAPVSSTDTQIHLQNPSNYLIWHAIGNIAFTTEWKEFDDIMTIQDDMAGGWSIAFNLNSVVKDAVDFYFDDLSWESMVLQEGLFVTGQNKEKGIPVYDFNNPIEFGYDANEELYVATVGKENDPDTWVNEIMISTVTGNKQAFMASTIKPSGAYIGEDNWGSYTESTNAKIQLPGNGVWKISIDPEAIEINIVMIAGEAKEPVDVVTYTETLKVEGLERDDLSDTFDQNTGERTGREGEGGEGETWDNQFFIKANRALEKGEVTHLHFKFRASREAKTTTQCHGETPGSYKHWAAIGDVNFTEEWQEFDADFTVPAEADGMWNIAFNMAEIKEACDYEITDVQWYIPDASLEEGKTYENLINANGDGNFFKKTGAGTTPEPTAIESVINTNTIGSGVIYNLSGQRVSKDYKGIVIINGRKVVNK